MERSCFLCNAEIDDGAKQYSEARAAEAWDAGLRKPGMYLSASGPYFACRSCSKMLDRAQNGLWKLIFSAVIFVIFVILTWLQIARFLKEGYWLIWRGGPIPIPVILYTGAGLLLTLYIFCRTLAAMRQAVRRFSEHSSTK